MRRTMSTAAVTVAASALVVLPAAGATAHVHGINPLECTRASAGAGANQAFAVLAGHERNPFEGITVIPAAKSPSLEIGEAGSDAAVCGLGLNPPG